ncbi:MAG: hypothetical protein H6Q19_504 [Bacteroidetes bacterium]|nr:hypothetical protein [Bacteroidota bacterium]
MNNKFISTYWRSIVVALIILFLSVYPFSSDLGLPRFQYRDKFIHSLMYVALAFVLYYDYHKIKLQVERFKHNLPLLLLFPLVFGGLIEIVQEAFFPPRTAEWLDWISDIAGSVIGFFFATIIFRK